MRVGGREVDEGGVGGVGCEYEGRSAQNKVEAEGARMVRDAGRMPAGLQARVAVLGGGIRLR